MTPAVWIATAAGGSMTDRGRFIWLLLCVLVTSPVYAGARLEGVVSLRWEGLTDRDALSPDYQDLRTRVQLTAPVTAMNARVHLEGWMRQSFAGHVAEPDEGSGVGSAYDQRRQVRRASVEFTRVAGGTLEIGRHRSHLTTVAALDADGVSWRRQGERLWLAATAGAPVPYWEPDAGIDATRLQAGGELGWRVGGWETGAGLLREEGRAPGARWRLGWQLHAPVVAGLRVGTRIDADPDARRWLSGRATLTWRRANWLAQVHATEREVSAFPAGTAADSLLYGGRSHELGLRLQRRWGRDLTTSLRLRSNTGAREYRFEELAVRWRGVPLDRGELALALSDSWSPWRQLEQLRLECTWWGLSRWTLAAGATVTAHEWRASRLPEWRLRARPHLSARWALSPSWVLQLQLKETLDEFTHLRTGATAGLTYRL